MAGKANELQLGTSQNGAEAAIIKDDNELLLLQRQKSKTGSELGNLQVQQMGNHDVISSASSTDPLKSESIKRSRIIDRIVLKQMELMQAIEQENLPFTILPLLSNPAGVCSYCGSTIYHKSLKDSESDSDPPSFIVGIPFLAHVLKTDRMVPVLYCLCSFTCYRSVANGLKKSENRTSDGMEAIVRSGSSLRSSRSRTF
jgi:hypothetical protein